MFRLDKYMQQWAEKYSGLKHSEQHPSFFRINDIFALDEFLQNYINIDYPCCGIVTHLDGRLNVPKRVQNMSYECIFLVRADETDYAAQADAKEQAWELMWEFLIYMDQDRQKEKASGERTALSMIDLTNLSADTLGPITNGWFQVNLKLDIQEQNKHCFNQEDYM